MKELLTYNPETGEFRWSAAPRSGVRAGAIAGNAGDGCRRIRIDRAEYKAHRLAWLYIHGRWPNGEIDHANGDPADNRLCNLRDATHSQNLGNCKKRVDNTSGRKGVARSASGKWRAHFRGQYLGSFTTEDEAHVVYQRAADAHYGAFARYE